MREQLKALVEAVLLERLAQVRMPGMPHNLERERCARQLVDVALRHAWEALGSSTTTATRSHRDDD